MTPEEFCELKPSELLRLAMRDLDKCEADPRYHIEMGEWHRPTDPGWDDNRCMVCLAGSVMAKTFGCDPDVDLTPDSAGLEGVSERLEALDNFRSGFIEDGVLACVPDVDEGILCRIKCFEMYDLHVSAYKVRRLRFKADMEYIAQFLDEECGL